MMQGRYEYGRFGGVTFIGPDGRVRVLRREFGLTWQGPAADGSCSREMHLQMDRYLHPDEFVPPEKYAEDPPSVSRPPGEQTPQPAPPAPPPPPPAPVAPSGG